MSVEKKLLLLLLTIRCICTCRYYKKFRIYMRFYW